MEVTTYCSNYFCHFWEWPLQLRGRRLPLPHTCTTVEAEVGPLADQEAETTGQTQDRCQPLDLSVCPCLCQDQPRTNDPAGRHCIFKHTRHQVEDGKTHLLQSYYKTGSVAQWWTTLVWRDLSTVREEKKKKEIYCISSSLRCHSYKIQHTTRRDNPKISSVKHMFFRHKI